MFTIIGGASGAMIAYSYDAAGNRLSYSGVVTNDSTAPYVTIVSPTSAPTFSTSNSLITFSGSASDDTGISMITWANDRGGIGSASGTASWSISAIPLQSGTNNITVTAYDFAGNSSSTVLVIIYSAIVPKPSVTAWGDNTYGQTNIMADTTGVVAVAAGGYHSLALRADGTVAAWGMNMYGETNVPIGLTNVVQVAGGGYFSLGLKGDGSVIAWGQYYNGTAMVPMVVPPEATNVIAIAGCGNHALALRSNGTVVAWGSDVYGETDTPLGLTNVVAVAGGYWHSIALRGDGTVAVWGPNWLDIRGI